jgi:hypothetical protein
MSPKIELYFKKLLRAICIGILCVVCIQICCITFIIGDHCVVTVKSVLFVAVLQQILFTQITHQMRHISR